MPNQFTDVPGPSIADFEALNSKAVKNTLNDNVIKPASGDPTLTLENSSSSGKAKIYASSEGGNLRLEKGLAHCEIDTQPMNNSGTGSVRLYVNDGTSTELTKAFLFKQDGSFSDGNGVNTKTLNDQVAPLSKTTKRFEGSSTYSIGSYGSYNIAICALYVENVGTSIISIQTAGSVVNIVHIAGTQNATNAISGSISNGTLTLTASNKFTISFINATMTY